jgi:hypothetical protein
LDKVRLLCPQDSAVQQSAAEVENLLGVEFSCDVQTEPLPFDDANSLLCAQQYLRALARILRDCERQGESVFLLLSGGRKNMSALTAAITPWFGCVKRLYHLLDRNEDDERKRVLYTAEELNGMTDDQRRRCLFPDKSSLNLFEVPHPGFLPDMARRRTALEARGELPEATDHPAFNDFWARVLGDRLIEEVLQVWLSRRAADEYQGFDSDSRHQWDRVFQRMTDPAYLSAREHGRFQNKQFSSRTDCKCLDLDSNHLRPFYHIDGPRLIVARATKHPGTYDQLIDGSVGVRREDHPAFQPWPLSSSKPIVLVASLGKEPMVASQAAVLLQQLHGRKVADVELVYAGGHRSIPNLAKELKAFEDNDFPCNLQPVEKIDDTNSTDKCQEYLGKVHDLVRGLQRSAPEDEIHFLLSGGRKTMAAMNLFAAQRAGLTKVWHTLVREPRRERRIEEAVREARSAPERHKIWFLQDPRFGADCFDIFPVPVSP